MSDAPSGHDLLRLAARTRELVLDLEAARADVLSVADLNRALRQVLRNQVAILDALAASQVRQPEGALAVGIAAGSQAPRSTPTPPAAPVGDAAASSGAQRRPSEPLVFEPDEPAPGAGRNNGTGAAPLAAEPATATAEAPSAAAPGEGTSLAEQILREPRVVPAHMARSIVEAFDNRDKNYDKGLEKLNRWVSGGAGTPFQWRGDRAYLNLNGAGAASAKNYEEQLMSRMGFSRRLGRLVVPGLQGEVIIYERPG